VAGLLVHDEKIEMKKWELVLNRRSPWIARCFSDRPREEMIRVLNGGKSLCCGCIGGEAKMYLQFLRIMMDNRYWEKCFVDQAMIDFFLYNQTFLAGGVPVTVKSTNSILHLTYYRWVPIYNGRNASIFDLSADGKTFPAVVHGCKAGACAMAYYTRCGFNSIEPYVSRPARLR
jgi:hypothetical protein